MTETVSAPLLADIIGRIRSGRPLVHSITNAVVMNWTANVCLALGAAPLMAQALEELEEICGLAQVLNLNIGTPDPASARAMLRAGSLMRGQDKRFVLDPVGAGASAYRLDLARAILDLKPAVIRGNAGELAALIGASGALSGVQARGVDSSGDAGAMVPALGAFARLHGAVVVVTGATDLVTDGHRLASVTGGTAMMTQVTGGGCALSAIVAACLAVEDDAYTASLAACAFYKGAAAEAARTAAGPGTLAVGLLDRMAGADPALLFRQVQIQNVKIQDMT